MYYDVHYEKNSIYTENRQWASTFSYTVEVTTVYSSLLSKIKQNKMKTKVKLLRNTNYVSSHIGNFSRNLIVLAFVATILFIFAFKRGTIKPISIPISINESINKIIGEPTFHYPNYSKKELDGINAAKQCYKLKNPDQNLQLLNDLENPPPKPDKSIFFVITTCSNTSHVSLTARYLNLELCFNAILLTLFFILLGIF